MESFKVPNRELSSAKPTNPNWREDSRTIASFARNLPQVAAGLIAEEQVDAWADGAAKIGTEKMAVAALAQMSGLGAKDTRTLIATSRGEYFPRDSAQEVYERKHLERVQIPVGPEAARERLVSRMAAYHLAKSYGLEPRADIMRQMARPDPSRNDSWLIGRPALVAEKDGEVHLFDIHVSDKSSSVLEPNDNIALHHYDLVAASMSQNIDHLHLIKVKIDPIYVDGLVTAASASAESEKALLKTAAHLFESSGDRLQIHTHSVEKDPALYEEIVNVGRANWAAIMRGEKPNLDSDPPLRLDESDEARYTTLAKNFVAAAQVQRVAEAQAHEAGDDLAKFMHDKNIHENFLAPYLGASFKKRDNFAAEQAATFLEQQMGVDPAHLRTPRVNVARLQHAYMEKGGDLGAFLEYDKADRKRIDTVAHDLGVSLEGFYVRTMATYVNPKTRGPIYEALEDIRDTASPGVEKMVSELAASPVMNGQALLDTGPAKTPSQSSMKV